MSLRGFKSEQEFHCGVFRIEDEVNKKDLISIVIADDQVLFAESLAQVITNRCEFIEIKGIAHNGEEAISMVEKHDPQVVIMDIEMPVMNGVEATKKIHERWPYIKIMVLTTFDDDEYVFDALKVGASGYILKNLPPDEIINCIRALEGGASQLSHRIAEKLINNPKADAATDIPDWISDIKSSDKEILKLLCNGNSIKEISSKVFLAEQTVKNHLSNLYSLMGVAGRSQAVKTIILNKWIKYL
jgi:DNA-binding NarL/FixJ family response regulator